MKRSFYSVHTNINQNKKLQISARMSSHEIINEETFLGNKYAIYNVNFYTNYKNWTAKKRYSDFEDFHRIIQNKIPDLILTEFPPKRLLKTSESTIQERKAKLEAYLNMLFNSVNICSYGEILEFIEFDKDLLFFIMKNNTMIESKTTTAVKRYYSLANGNSRDSFKRAKSYEIINGSSYDNNYYSSFLNYKLQNTTSKFEKSDNMLVIEEFLRNLEFKSENKYQIVKSFEQFLKGKKVWPYFKSGEINILFYGEKDMHPSNLSEESMLSENSNTYLNTLNGLLHHVGNIEQNILGAESCLEFLSKLIDYEFNPDCEAYIHVLKQSQVEFFNYVRLKDYAKSNKNYIVNIVFRIIRSIVNEDKCMRIKLKKLINDEEVCKKFIDWMNNN
jgi:hypothetical protein